MNGADARVVVQLLLAVPPRLSPLPSATTPPHTSLLPCTCTPLPAALEFQLRFLKKCSRSNLAASSELRKTSTGSYRAGAQRQLAATVQEPQNSHGSYTAYLLSVSFRERP